MKVIVRILALAAAFLTAFGVAVSLQAAPNLATASPEKVVRLVVPDEPSELEGYAAAELAEHLHRVLGKEPEVTRISELGEGFDHLVIFGRLDNNPLLQILAGEETLMKEQGYVLKIEPPDGGGWRVSLCGADPLGALYAVRDFTHFHLYATGEGPVMQAASLSHAPPIKTRYQSESGCNLFSAMNPEADFMRKPSLNGHSREVVFDKHYYLDWLSHWKVTHLNISWCNSPAYDEAWNDMTAYANSRGIQVWRHFVPYRPQHEYPPEAISSEPPESRKGDCPRDAEVRQWYLDRMVQMVTQKPLIAGIVIESPYHDGIYCHCELCRGKANAFSESEMLNEFVGLARRHRPGLEIIRVTKNAVPDAAAARKLAAEMQDIDEQVDINVNTFLDREHRKRWHDLGPRYGTYLRTFRSALKGKDPHAEIDFLYRDFQASAERGVTAHGFCYRFYNARYGSFTTQQDRHKIADFPDAVGPLSLALVAEAAFDPFASEEWRKHKFERLLALTIPDYAIGRFDGAATAEREAPFSLPENSRPEPSRLFRYQYGLADRDKGYTIAAVCADIAGDARREIVYASRDSDKLHLLDAATGRTIWSRQIRGDHQSISAFDLDADGVLEIFYTTSSPGRLYVVDSKGEVQRQWDSGDWKLGNSPVIIDADGDGVLDGYFGSRSKYLVRLRMSDLEVLERRSGWVQCGCYTSALDVDGDGRWDLFAGSGDDKAAKGVLHRYDPASLETLWSHPTNDNASSADPVLVDIDGDGRVEILKSVDNYKSDDAHDAVAAYTTDGEVLWKVDGLSGEDSPNAADLDGDGEIEIVGMTFGSEVYCLDAKGRVKWRKDLRPELDNSAKANLAPILCDLDGDAELEILAITNGAYFDGSRDLGHKANGVLVALSASGEILDRIDVGAARCWNNAFVCNVDDDDLLEVVLSGSGHVDVFETRGFGPDTDHLQRRRDYRRLNVLPWAWENTYFLHGGERQNVALRADSLVLARDGEGYAERGRFVTEAMRLPDGFRFTRLRVGASIPPDTVLAIHLLSESGETLVENLSRDEKLSVDRTVRLEFIFSSSKPDATPVLRDYSLEFGR